MIMKIKRQRMDIFTLISHKKYFKFMIKQWSKNQMLYVKMIKAKFQPINLKNCKKWSGMYWISNESIWHMCNKLYHLWAIHRHMACGCHCPMLKIDRCKTLILEQSLRYLLLWVCLEVAVIACCELVLVYCERV